MKASSAPAGVSALKELAPTGALRVAVAVGSARSALWADRDPASGAPRGITVDLGHAFAKRLGLPLELVEYASSGLIANAVDSGDWDVSFMPVDAERKAIIAFGFDYVLAESSVLVPPGSKVAALSELDRPGVRIGGVEGTATIRSARRAFAKAEVSGETGFDALIARMKDGTVDGIALGRDSLMDLATRLAGSRVLPGAFHAAGIAIALPKGRPMALALAEAFLELVKADGTVAKALADNGLAGPVAPAGSRS